MRITVEHTFYNLQLLHMQTPLKNSSRESDVMIPSVINLIDPHVVLKATIHGTHINILAENLLMTRSACLI